MTGLTDRPLTLSLSRRERTSAPINLWDDTSEASESDYRSDGNSGSRLMITQSVLASHPRFGHHRVCSEAKLSAMSPG